MCINYVCRVHGSLVLWNTKTTHCGLTIDNETLVLFVEIGIVQNMLKAQVMITICSNLNKKF